MKNIFSEFNSRKTGLTAGDILANRTKFGVNELEVKKPESWWVKLLRQFSDLLVIILLLAGFLALFLGERIDAIVILVIVAANAFIGFFQEFKTERMLEALQKLVALNSKVLRNGKIQMIPASEVTVGDILILEEGMKIPADAVLLEANELKVDEAILTGESVPTHKLCDSKNKRERKVFSSTEIVNGSGRAICCAVGRETEFGKIAKLTTSTKKSDSPLTKEMKTIGVFVGKVALAISVLLFVVGFYFQEYTLIQSLLFAVAVAVAAVPEGLPVTITTALALGMRRLADKKALVKDLKSVETLGATTVICSDKTGTLTRNQMVVRRGWLPSSGEFSVSGVGYDSRNGKVEVSKSLGSTKLFEIADAVNDSEVQKKGRHWKILGDPTEGALRVVARKFGIKKHWKRVETFPFDSDRKRMSVVIGSEVLAKGGVEAILEKSTHFFENGNIKKLTPQIRKKILKTSEGFAADALRVLGFAFRKVTQGKMNHETAEQKLIFVGMLGMYDSPRKEVRAAVDSCKLAGIRITVITGDFGVTAKAIAKELGIASDATRVITGDDLKKLKDSQLKKILRQKENIIFARVKPADKLRVVDTYKKLGEVVAVTGDGVNDAPALKRADIGVAMGRCGADVAKEAASLVLTNDSFASIVDAVAEGRRIYSNMQKFIAYIFSCNIGELTVVLMAIFIGIPIPLTAVLILLVNLGTDLLPSLALGIDAANPEEMQQAPRNPKLRILRKKFVIHFLWMGGVIGILVLGGYIGVLLNNGWSFGEILSPESPLHIRAASFAFATLVIIQLFNAFNFRSKTLSAFSPQIQKNNFLWIAVAISLLLVFVVVETPLAQKIFATAHLSSFEWLAVITISASILFFEEMRKIFSRVFTR
jgi:P-type Ca2+ transporter type 2C